MTNETPPQPAVTVEQADEALAEAVIGAANIVSHDGYYEIDIDAVTQTIAAHRLAQRSAATGREVKPALVVVTKSTAQAFRDGFRAAYDRYQYGDERYDDEHADQALVDCLLALVGEK